ncbi:hypothetical protein COV11_01330 [Candidatus Woesearchaeota archaeon CG10_big_fil_rev_8_21_14_0_10_30_7]|nr:MAG: hypothetical protein COV11_01330 [Candidatus Woesearchaeota archaeon CG10_big_fil_rev_8_21_14_0_10_30_7]
MTFDIGEKNLENYELLIEKLGLTPIQDLGGSCIVYKVLSDKNFRIMKLGYKDKNDGWDYQHVNRENEVLNCITGVNNISQKIKTYSSDNKRSFLSKLFNPSSQDIVYIALLKEYIEGTELKENRISSTRQQIALIEAVKAVHEAGYARLDITPRNIIITANCDPYIIDLGHAQTKKELQKNTAYNFQKRTYQDFYDLEELFI